MARQHKRGQPLTKSHKRGAAAAARAALALAARQTPEQIAAEAASFVTNFESFSKMLKRERPAASSTEGEQAEGQAGEAGAVADGKKRKLSKLVEKGARGPAMDFLAWRRLLEMREALEELRNGPQPGSSQGEVGPPGEVPLEAVATLVAKEGGEGKWDLSEGGTLRLGRCTEEWSAADVVLTTKKASKRHAVIACSDAATDTEGLPARSYSIENLGKNGVIVDGKPLKQVGAKVSLQIGSNIQIGEQRFELVQALVQA